MCYVLCLITKAFRALGQEIVMQYVLTIPAKRVNHQAHLIGFLGKIYEY